MLQFVPLIVWLAAMTSAFLLIMLWALGEIGLTALVVLITWFGAAAYCQFLGGSAIVSVAGLAGQTILAIYLILRWTISA